MDLKKLDIGTIVVKLKSLGQRLGKYLGLVFIIGLVAMYSFLVFRVNTLTTGEPDDDAIAEKLKTVQRPKIDQAAIDKIEQLQDNSTEVKTLFQAARDNPFHE